MVTFKDSELHIGDIKPFSTNFINFPFEGSPKEILTVQPSCGCIAEWSIVNNNLQLKFTEKDGEIKRIRKYVTVFFKQNHTTVNRINPATGMKEMNTEAPNVILHFTANVVQ